MRIDAVNIIVSTWHSVVLVTFVLGAAVIFVGIEGNHEKYIAFLRFEEQFEFNQSLKNVSS